MDLGSKLETTNNLEAQRGPLMINIENKSQEGNVKEKKDHNEYSLISLIVDSIAVPLVSNPNPNPNYNETSKLV